MAGFDPRPGDMVMHVDRQAGPFTRLLVRERNGSQVRAWPLGFEAERITRLGGRVEYHVGELVPNGGYGHG